MTKATTTAKRQPRTPRKTSAKAPEKPAAAETKPALTRPKGKLDTLVALLRRPEGATIYDLAEATGWQVHSVRGAIAGALKKGRGLNVISAKTDAGRFYRIEEAQA